MFAFHAPSCTVVYDRPGPFLNHGIEGLLPGEITRKAELSAPERHA